MPPEVLRSRVRLKLAVVVLAAIFSLAVFSPLPIRVEQGLGLSMLFNLRGPRPPPDDILIISINEVAGRNLDLPGNTTAWPRSLYADVIRRLDDLQANMIVMDIAFRELRDPHDDAALAEAIKESGKVLLFKYLKRQQLRAEGTLLDLQEEISPLSIFEQYALGAGAFALPRYPAQVVYAPLFLELAEGLEPSQPMMAFILHQRAKLERIWFNQLYQHDALSQTPTELARQYRQTLRNDNLIDTFALDSQDGQFISLLGGPRQITINFYGPSGTISTLSIDQLISLEPDLLADRIRNKIVYIGYSTDAQTEQKDAYRTVFTDKFGVDLSGVEISATVFANLIDRSYINILPLWKLLLVVAGFVLLARLSWRLKPTGNIVLQSAVLTGYLGMAAYAFTGHNNWWPVITPLIAALLANSILLMFRYLDKSARVEQISHALRQYLPADAARKLGNNFQNLEKQHQLVAGVCLLTDIRGYTRLSESLPPSELHQLMNDYYAELVGIIDSENGIIGNIVGDSMLALWSGPEMTSEMCRSALRAARTIQQRIAEHPVFAASLPTCTGLHGGPFSLGHLGARGHFEYSPVGDIINTTARIEHFNRTLQTDILFSSVIADQIAADFETNESLLELGSFDLRNKSKAVNLFTLSDNEELIRQFSLALDEFRQGRLEEADHRWRSLITQYNHGPSRFYHAQILNLTRTV